MRTPENWSIGCGAVLLFALSALSADAATETRAPSSEELRAMYCAEMLRGEITLQNHLLAASSEAAGVSQPESREQWIDTSAELLRQLAKLEGALYRLQVYMLPRISTIDSQALASAIRQANADAREAASNGAMLARMRGCEDPTWIVP